MTNGDVQVLAVYGSLSRGEANHWVINQIAGDWFPGTVRGWRFEITWGPAEGYDGFIADSEGSVVQVELLVSDKLDKNWREVDDFHGDGYRRIPIEVMLESGEVLVAQIYEAVPDS